ncbi:hypothetical protein C8R46DRAFT_1042810 [Mycena filopes]|nr:hypothetical protein C8R46DRAFT_1042810 [Mycena filopes]
MSYGPNSTFVDYRLVTEVMPIGTELLVYVLFFLAMGFLIHRKTGGQKVLLIYTVVFFLFGTTQLVLGLVRATTVVRLLLQEGDQSDITDGLNRAQFAIFWTNKCVDEGARYSKFTGAAGAVTTLKFSNLLPCVFAALTNLVLVLFTAGRIWSACRDSLHVFEGNTVRSYNTAVAMTLESGAIYFIVTVILLTTTKSYLFNQNIVPTLIAVRVGLGHYIQDTGIKGQILHSPEERPATRRPVAPPQSPRGPVLYIKSSEYIWPMPQLKPKAARSLACFDSETHMYMWEVQTIPKTRFLTDRGWKRRINIQRTLRPTVGYFRHQSAHTPGRPTSQQLHRALRAMQRSTLLRVAVN